LYHRRTIHEQENPKREFSIGDFRAPTLYAPESGNAIRAAGSFLAKFVDAGANSSAND
jgi:hypothetical protein